MLEIDSLAIGPNHVVGNQRSFATAVSITVVDMDSYVHAICGVFRNIITRYNRRFAISDINTVAIMVACNRVTADLNAINRLNIETIILSDSSVVGNLKLAVVSCTIV